MLSTLNSIFAWIVLYTESLVPRYMKRLWYEETERVKKQSDKKLKWLQVEKQQESSSD